ncbi:hypothetical protein QAD02_021530 [Eretmocerus hayati]|uniref:Uncharacterized protein n=1 Tax=Eretmocerus hayati TaxID=131215 RepID=A0ACC2PTN1_9HYME|nr:hypothetical protein QAD02_021530 [Eretmocerus hayati]
MNTRCVNPFETENHKNTKGLVNVPENISEKYPWIPEYSKICVACKLDFTKQKAPTNAKKCKFVKVECNDANHIAENYTFVVQNSAQSFHWNNNQATIFTVVIYYVENGELKHGSLAIISDN